MMTQAVNKPSKLPPTDPTGEDAARRHAKFGRRNIVSIPGLNHKDWYYRLIQMNDEEIRRYSEYGFSIVPRDEVPQKFFGSLGVNQTVGTLSCVTISGRDGVTLVLVKQRREHRLEDEAARRAEVDASEAALNRDEGVDYGDELTGKVKVTSVNYI